jgi:signal transduction histidine kinase
MFKFIHSMKFRVWLIFIGFASIMLGFLYLNQIILLPNFYEFIKTQETRGTAQALIKSWNNENFFDEVWRLSRVHDNMRIDVDKKIGDNLYITFSTLNGESIQGVLTDFLPSADLLNEVINSNNGVVSDIFEMGGQRMICYAVLVGTPHDVMGMITIFNHLQPLGNTQDVLKSQFFLSACVMFVVAFALSAFVVLSISAPIVKISGSAKKLTTGEFAMQTRKSDYAEIKTLAESLNVASREIAKTENLRKDLLANVSHDLKTPLTMIKAYAEMIRDLSGDNPEKRTKHVRVIIDEADRLNGLVADMLDLSKIQSGVATKKLSLFNFSLHLSEVINRFGYLIEEQSITIEPEIEENIFIKADVTKIEQVVYNLINNAVNYTGDDGSVTVRLFRKKEGVGRFEVRDTGSGIARDELPYIWERYYKAAKSQFHKRTTVGTGLGLSIVKGVMEIHGYGYGVDSTLDKGSTFWFEFPVE